MIKFLYKIKPAQWQKIICLLVVLLTITNLLHAQIGDPSSGGTGNGDVDDAPIDGGLSLLVAAGVGYGVKQIKQRRKKLEL